MRERAAVAAQHVSPKQALTAFAGSVANFEGGALTTALVRWFIKRYGVDMSQAAEADPAAYATFNAFFTRALKPGVRPLAGTDLLCPVDGGISQFGAIEGERIFQAKGHHYSTTALLGGDAAAAEPYRDGHFATIYLAPKDYHRIHMPTSGRLLSMVHVPGALYSVNPTTARGVPGLFARNERVVCHFEGKASPFAMVLVGATIVGSMETVWHGVVNPPRPGRVRSWRYENQRIELPRGAEMGRFRLGSTVVLLFPPGPLRFETAWAPGVPVQMGQSMAQRL
ncbi:MAG: archaetidylserine decarboxylase [Pseudomonadota bacterium]|nr:archaetidylserine decarboxylase [Pseudomonadota bacterium]